MDKVSYITHMKGHKNSKGESAPWVIKSHDGGKVLSSHKTKEEAVSHLRDIEGHKKKGSFRGIDNIDELLKTSEESV